VYNWLLNIVFQGWYCSSWNTLGRDERGQTNWGSVYFCVWKSYGWWLSFIYVL